MCETVVLNYRHRMRRASGWLLCGASQL